MSKIQQITAKQAIDRSISHDEIVHIEGDNQAHGDLRAECADSAEHRGSTPGDSLTEYWGDRDGQSWRVHVHGHEA